MKYLYAVGAFFIGFATAKYDDSERKLYRNPGEMHFEYADGTPVGVITYIRAKHRWHFEGEADASVRSLIAYVNAEHLCMGMSRP